MKILIVEDEPLLAATLKQLVELNPLYEVTAIADDLDAAMRSVEAQAPELALVDPSARQRDVAGSASRRGCTSSRW